MPDIALLEPMVLRGVVEQFVIKPELVMLNRVPRVSWPFQSVTWDIVKGSRMMSKPNVPSAEAHIVPRLGRSQQNTSFIHMRDKKMFDTATLHFLRAPGQLNAIRAEEYVLRELNDLSNRIDVFMEFAIWSALKGHLNLDYQDVNFNVDFMLPDSHYPKPAVGWDVATPSQIHGDVVAWKRLIRRDGWVDATDVFTTAVTMNYIFDSFASNGVGGTTPGTLLSDRMKEAYWSTNTLPGFMGLDWHLVEDVYDDSYGNMQMFVPDNSLFMGNYTANDPIQLYEGEVVDEEAPEGFTGRFAKTWIDKDPSGRQYLVANTFMPVLTRPFQLAFCSDVTSTA